METTKKFIPLALLLSLFIKQIIIGFTIPETIVFMGILGLYALNEYHIKSSQIKKHDEQIADLHKKIDAQAKDIEAAKTYVTSIKMAQQLRPGKIG